MTKAYYNECDKKTAAWLRELIKEGLIIPGDVDERSITEVHPIDLMGYTQCHFFAGIGGWSYALRLAGWPDDRPVWTGSCPCQPFSTAGKGLAQADARHLWPHFFRLIRECRPDIVFGEQVEGAVGKGWLDGVQRDVEGEGYALGSAVLGAHSVGAPHIRQRLYWVADMQCEGHEGRLRGREDSGREDLDGHAGCDGAVGGLADNDGQRCDGEPVRLCEGRSQQAGTETAWGGARVILCRDNKHRRVPAESILQRVVDGVPEIVVDVRPESGFPLCQKIDGRVILLRGYGNAIVPQCAQAFIEAYIEARLIGE